MVFLVLRLGVVVAVAATSDNNSDEFLMSWLKLCFL